MSNASLVLGDAYHNTWALCIRNSVQELDEVVKEKSRKFDMEKHALTDDNNELHAEIEKVHLSVLLTDIWTDRYK